MNPDLYILETNVLKQKMAVIIFEIGAPYRTISDQINSLLNNLNIVHKKEKLIIQ